MPAPFGVRLAMRDPDGNPTGTSFWIGSITTTPATPAVNIIEAIDPLVAGIITGASLVTPIDLTGATLKTAYNGQFNRKIGGYFQFSSPLGFFTEMTLPSFRESAYVPDGSNNIDTADADVAAFLAAFLGATTTTNQDQEVTANTQAYMTYGGKKG